MRSNLAGLGREVSRKAVGGENGWPVDAEMPEMEVRAGCYERGEDMSTVCVLHVVALAQVSKTRNAK